VKYQLFKNFGVVADIHITLLVISWKTQLTDYLETWTGLI
jgi:hypothetical protein